MPVILRLRRLRQLDHSGFEASLDLKNKLINEMFLELRIGQTQLKGSLRGPYLNPESSYM